MKTTTSFFPSDIRANDLIDKKGFASKKYASFLRYWGNSDDFQYQTWNRFGQKRKKLFPETTDN